MPDCFISYSTADEKVAASIRDLLATQNISVFMASVSLQPGQNWSKEIWNKLHASKWVIFLASEKACSSPYVQQELGAALATQKNIVPILWDMDASRLPGWIDQKQALDLRGKSVVAVGEEIKKIAGTIVKYKERDQLILLAICLGLLLFLALSK
jgi:hypothetical protein